MPAEIDDKPLGRKICGLPMVLYRAGDGQATALEDFCPHRGAPLSLGRVTEGKLVCGYHGLGIGCAGKVIAMPGQRAASFPTIRAYPVVERHGFVWVWPGDAALADPALVPACDWADSPEWAYGGGLFHIDCDYRLMIDNLMDLTHETFTPRPRSRRPASWSTSSRPRARPRSGTSGAWRATSTRATRR